MLYLMSDVELQGIVYILDRFFASLRISFRLCFQFSYVDCFVLSV